jgi:hypothetical protein
MRYRNAITLRNPGQGSFRGGRYRALVSQYGVTEAARIWRSLPESQKGKYAASQFYVNPCGVPMSPRGRRYQDLVGMHGVRGAAVKWRRPSTKRPQYARVPIFISGCVGSGRLKYSMVPPRATWPCETYKCLVRTIREKAHPGYRKIEDFLGWETDIDDKKADLREWFSYSANYTYWSMSGVLVFCEGNTELSGCPVSEI